MTTRRIGALTALAAIVLAVVWYAALWRPQSNHLRAAHAAYSQAQAQIAQLDQQVADLQVLEREKTQDQARLADLNTKLPTSADLQDVLTQLHVLANASGVELTSVSPATQTPVAASGGASSGNGSASSGLNSLSLSMNASGPYPAVRNFLSGLTHLTRTLVIDSVSISSGVNNSLTMSMTARIFDTN